MSYTIISGMSLDYYNNIGQAMVESWLRYWPKEYTLKIYTEDTLPINNNRIQLININNIDPMYTEFQNAKFKLETRSKRFAKKAWPIMKNLDNNNGYLIWVDADVITEDYITQEYLDSLIPSDCFSCHIGVPQGQYYSVETGFFIIDKSNKFKDEFLDKYKYIYYNRDFSDMHKPFDGDAFGKVIRDLKTNNQFTYKELNSEKMSKSPFNHIFKNKMKHYKAKRKNTYNEQ
jgi:hypothetical protein|tara:strand:- start:2110 stop:2802 length:693 start_codon:yes stop_codon:yes gene_type:complete